MEQCSIYLCTMCVFTVFETKCDLCNALNEMFKPSHVFFVAVMKYFFTFAFIFIKVHNMQSNSTLGQGRHDTPTQLSLCRVCLISIRDKL